MIDAARLDEFLRKSDETSNLEFKLKYVLTGQMRGKFLDEIAKDLLALTNTSGRSEEDYAYLVIGTGDKLKPDGTRDKEDVRPYGYSREQFLDIVNARCTPRVQDLAYAEVELDGNYYGVVEIPPSPYIHELTRNLDTPKGVWQRGCVLVRHGDQVGVASPQELRLMEQEKGRLAQPPASVTEQLEECLTDPTKKLKARNLVIGEARRLHGSLNDPEFLKRDRDDRYAAIAERMREYEELTGNFLPLLITGCHDGEEWLQTLWSDALSIIASSSEAQGGSPSLVRLRRYPALLLLYAGGMAAIAGNRYGNLAALLMRTQVRSPGSTDGVTFGLAPGWIIYSSDAKHLPEGKWHKMPFNYHISEVLKKPMEGFIHTAEQYMECFVRFEYLFALFSVARNNGLLLGSYVWESELRRGHQRYHRPVVPIIMETDAELDRMGADWQPLKSGLFVGSLEDFKAFKTKTDQTILEQA